MKYPHIKKAKLSHATISKAFGFKNIKSFRCSSAHKRYMCGVDEIVRLVKENKTDINDSDGFVNIRQCTGELRVEPSRFEHIRL